MPSLEKNRNEVLKKCKRHCALCERYMGLKIEIHHIVQKTDGGSDDVDNLIPLCFDCHQEVGSYNPKHPKGSKYTIDELKARRNDVYNRVAKGELPVHGVSVQQDFIKQDYERRLNIEKDFRGIYALILADDLRRPPVSFITTCDELYAKYIANSFFANSTLLYVMDRMCYTIAMKAHPDGPPIKHDDPVMKEIEEYRKKFIQEYQRLFFV